MDLTLNITVGVSGSGKSTWAKNYARDNRLSYISTDLIRLEMFGNESVQDLGNVVFRLAKSRIYFHLSGGRSVIFDALNHTPKARKFIRPFKDLTGVTYDQQPFNLKIIAICFDIPLDVCLNRNDSRDRKLPHELIESQKQQLQYPTLSEVDDIKWVKYNT
jgi:predicted kinase